MKKIVIVHRFMSLVSTLAVLFAAGCFDLEMPDEIDFGDGDADTDTDTDTDIDTGADPLDCDGGRYDSSTGLCWQHPTVCCYEWQQAIDYCEGLFLNGHTDWYLPSKQDFIDLLGGCDSGVLGGGTGYCDSCGSSGTCSALFGSDVDWYWSSSYDSYPWGVSFVDGYVSYVGGGYSHYVRCVREEP